MVEVKICHDLVILILSKEERGIIFRNKYLKTPSELLKQTIEDLIDDCR